MAGDAGLVQPRPAIGLHFDATKGPSLLAHAPRLPFLILSSCALLYVCGNVLPSLPPSCAQERSYILPMDKVLERSRTAIVPQPVIMMPGVPPPPPPDPLPSNRRDRNRLVLPLHPSPRFQPSVLRKCHGFLAFCPSLYQRCLRPLPSTPSPCLPSIYSPRPASFLVSLPLPRVLRLCLHFHSLAASKNIPPVKISICSLRSYIHKKKGNQENQARRPFSLYVFKTFTCQTCAGIFCG